ERIRGRQGRDEPRRRVARRVHQGRAPDARLRNRSDARCDPEPVRLRVHQRHDHRHPEERQAHAAGVGLRQVGDDEHARARRVLQCDQERPVDDRVDALERARSRRAFRDVPQDLREPEVRDVADRGVGRLVHECRPELRHEVAGRDGQEPCGRPRVARQAARRTGSAGQGRRRSVEALAVPMERRRARKRAAWRRRRLVLLLMSPWLVGFSVFFGYPLVMSAYLSFNHYDLLSAPRWVGLANYRYLFSVDPQTWTAVRNTGYMIGVLVPLQVLSAFGLALMLARARAGVGVFRTIFYLPALAPPVAATLGFVFILNPATGPVNTILSHLGINGPLWFQDPSWAKPSLVMLGIWGVGNTMIIFLAAVLDVPRTLYESAQLDGAGPLQRLRYVTVPSISPVLLFATVLGVIQGLQYFTQAYVAAGVASGQASQAADVTSVSLGYPVDSTLFYPVLLYQHGFVDFQMGYASAMAMFLFAVSFDVTLAIVINSRRWVHSGAR